MKRREELLYRGVRDALLIELAERKQFEASV